jgi:hypothetical protein
MLSRSIVATSLVSSAPQQLQRTCSMMIPCAEGFETLPIWQVILDNEDEKGMNGGDS